MLIIKFKRYSRYVYMYIMLVDFITNIILHLQVLFASDMFICFVAMSK